MNTRINIGSAASSGGPVTFYSVKIGQPHPYLKPHHSDGTSIDVDPGWLAVTIFCAPPLDSEIRLLAGTLVGCGLYLTQDYLAPIFIFQDQSGSLPIVAPLVSSQEQVRNWIGADTNSVNLCLMEAVSGVVRQLRTVGLPLDFMAIMKNALGDLQHPADPETFRLPYKELGEKGMWDRSLQWTWDARKAKMCITPAALDRLSANLSSSERRRFIKNLARIASEQPEG